MPGFRLSQLNKDLEAAGGTPDTPSTPNVSASRKRNAARAKAIQERMRKKKAAAKKKSSDITGDDYI